VRSVGCQGQVYIGLGVGWRACVSLSSVQSVRVWSSGAVLPAAESLGRDRQRGESPVVWRASVALWSVVVRGARTTTEKKVRGRSRCSREVGVSRWIVRVVRALGSAVDRSDRVMTRRPPWEGDVHQDKAARAAPVVGVSGHGSE